ncbi:hypothetical protein AYO47_07895 [Planctomyces sp. SCGC AG-212-M04]|nr:hypothetical protein AYO47_07895 [Planctomyces sp. SCGC AG-212-M04]
MAGVLLVATPANALDVEGFEWGFDGHVVQMSFNLLTIKVRNNSPTPFEGNIVLQEGNAVVRTDLPLVERQLYIEPFGQRSLQFFPYVTEAWAEYTLVWGNKQEESYTVAKQTNAPLRSGPRAMVLLRDASTSRQLKLRLATFEEADFPISAAGTDALRGVVLDHVPRWDPLRMQAFRDWIGAGGQLHIMQMETGQYPTFPAPLEALNEPSDVVALGNGQVHHHSRKVSEIDDQFVSDKLGIQRRPEEGNNPGYQNMDYQYRNQVSDNIAQLLRGLTRPDHNWGLIYFLSFIYLLVVFPGCWLLGRRRADFRISYPALLGAVFLFSMAFKTVGQRGYGEQTAWNAVSTVRRVAPGRFLTETFSNAFVTSGGMYAFKHAGEGQIYSSGGSNDTRRGECFNRPNSGIEIEIPPFSSQTFLHAGIVSSPDFDVDFKKARIEGNHLDLEVELNGQIPTIYTTHAVYGNQHVTLTRSGNVLRSSPGESNLFQYTQNNNYGYGYGRNNTTQTDPTTIYAAAEMPLFIRNLWLSTESRNNNNSNNELKLSGKVVRVYLYADMPAEFLEVTGGPEKRQGRVLYVFEHPYE